MVSEPQFSWVIFFSWVLADVFLEFFWSTVLLWFSWFLSRLVGISRWFGILNLFCFGCYRRSEIWLSVFLFCTKSCASGDSAVGVRWLSAFLFCTKSCAFWSVAWCEVFWFGGPRLFGPLFPVVRCCSVVWPCLSCRAAPVGVSSSWPAVCEGGRSWVRFCAWCEDLLFRQFRWVLGF